MARKKRNERKHSPAKRRNRITRYITVEHRDSWGEEVRINKGHDAMLTAMKHPRNWLVIITVWFKTPTGEEYFDTYKTRFDGCTLGDDKSIGRFELLRDKILSEGNPLQKVDWGWFAAPWTAKARAMYAGGDDQIMTAEFE